MENKYDTNITLDENSSLTYMVKRILPHSAVLEFGPATGYMTRYLQEELGCDVHIVEIDAEAYQKARVYAKEGLCGNIENYEWDTEQNQGKFDYITFADVLEHLQNPWEVMRRAAELLKPDGKLLVSLPNIGHNAVLIDLMNNKFRYRKTGILDNTHLRFFTRDAMIEMFEKCGLSVLNEEAVIFGLEYTGFENNPEDVSEDMWWELRLREYGFVNQFLFTLGKAKETLPEKNVKKAEVILEDALYYTVGNAEYTEEKKAVGSISLYGNRFETEFVFETEFCADRMKIDLLPYPGRIHNFKIDIKAEIAEIIPIYGEKLDQIYWFYEAQTRLELRLQTLSMINRIKISGEFYLIPSLQFVKYLNTVRDRNLVQTIRLEQEIGRLNKYIEDKIKDIALLNESLCKKDETVQGLSSDVNKAREELARVRRKLKEKRDEWSQSQRIYVKHRNSWTRYGGATHGKNRSRWK